MIRLCHPHDFYGYHYIREGSTKFDGSLSLFPNQALEFADKYAQARSLNLSIVIERGSIFTENDLSSENLEGCLEGLQANRSDIYLGLVNYPLNAENITQGLIATDGSLVIGSMYTKGAAEMTQVLSSFDCFSWTVWLMCVLSLLCLALLLRARNSIGGKSGHGNHYNFLYMATHMVRLNQIDDRGVVRRLLYLTASVFSLIVVHYFCSFIKTELVTIKDPKVFTSYQDIIDRGALPIFVRGMFYDVQFKRPDAPSYRKKLWTYSTTAFREEDLLTDLDPGSLVLAAIDSLMERRITIHDSNMMPLVPYTGCALLAHNPKNVLTVLNQLMNNVEILKSTMKVGRAQKGHSERFFKRYANIHFDSAPNSNFFTSVDPNEKQYILGVVMASGTEEWIKSLYSKLFSTWLETGIMEMLKDRALNVDLMNGREEMTQVLGPVDKSRFHLVEECRSCKIVRPDVGFHPLTLQNFKTLFKLMAVIIPGLFLVLAMEKIGFIKSHRRVVVSRPTRRIPHRNTYPKSA